MAGTVLTWSSPELDKLGKWNETTLEEPATDDEKAWISSFFPLGAIFGPFLFGYLADKIGRKITLLVTGIPFVLFYFLLAFANALWMLYISRCILGIALGGVFTVIPMYVGEIADDSNRGALGSAMNVFLCLGLLFSYSLGPYVSIVEFNLVLAVFPLIFLAVFFFAGLESPQYYVSKHEIGKAKEVLLKLRGGGSNVEEELATMQKKMEEDGKGSLYDIFQSKGLIKAMIISIGLVFFQQFSGINAVLFYAQKIFEQAGSSLAPEVCSIIIGAVQFGTSFVTPLLADRLGRKILLTASAAGMLISEVPLGVYCYLKAHDHDVSSISFLPVVCLIAYIITYNCGYGPLPWAIMGELFPNNVKSIASSVTAGFCWFCGFLIAFFFKSLSNTIGMGPSFWLFSSFCALAIPFSLFFVLETKGKSLDEIQDVLNS